MPRIYCSEPVFAHSLLDLPAGAARHVQVLRMQPGHTLTLFGPVPEDAPCGEYSATITRMGRQDVQVQVNDFVAVERGLPVSVHLAVGMPANERMDWLVEKATELGVASIQPLMTERSVLRLEGERAAKKLAHWQAVAVAACEQCGGNRVPMLHPVRTLAQWLATPALGPRWVASLHDDALPLATALPTLQGARSVLIGPEGGLSAAEEALARQHGARALGLGPRVLRSETAALAVLAAHWALL